MVGDRPLKTTDHFRHIDGLRGISIGLVLLFHFDAASAPGGYVGVDVFFVISGFLIVRLIVQALETGDFSLWAFWNRRVRRLAPTIAVTLLFSLAVGFVVMTVGDYRALGLNVLLAASSLINLSLIGQTGYFDDGVVQNPLVHFWSLAVEEQFYLGFPLLALGLFARFGKARGRTATVWALLVLGAGSFASSELLLRAGQKNLAYYLMPTRFGELAFGGALSLVLQRPEAAARLGRLPRGLGDLVTLAGLTGILFSAITYHRSTPFPGLSALPVTAGSLAVLAFGERGYLRLLLGNPPLEYLGRISFVLYLFHWPCWSLYSYYVSRMPSPVETVLLALTALAASVVVHHGIEDPVRFSRKFANTRMYYVVGPAIGATIVAAVVVVVNDGYPTRVAENRRNLVADPQQFHVKNFGGAGFAQFTVLTLGAKSARPEFLLLGDSKMRQFAFGIDRVLMDEGRAALLYTDDGCGFLTTHALLYDGHVDSGCLASAERALQLARSNDLPIIFARAWDGYIEKLADLRGQPMTVSPTKYARLNADMLRGLADANRSRGKIHVVANTPRFTSALPAVQCLARPSFLGLPCARQNSFLARDQTPHEIERETERLLAADARFSFLGMGDVFCPSGECSQVSGEGTILFSDPSHLSKDGSLALAPRLLWLAGLNPHCGGPCRPTDLAPPRGSRGVHAPPSWAANAISAPRQLPSWSTARVGPEDRAGSHRDRTPGAPPPPGFSAPPVRRNRE